MTKHTPEALQGGRDGVIFRKQNTVIRPMNPWSDTVHLLLTHLHNQGFHQCPAVVGIDGSNEVLSYLEGDTFNYPLRGAIATEEALFSAARLLRQLHDASTTFLNAYPDFSCQWMLPGRTPPEVICHGDFTPYNVVLKGNQVVGIFDFDTAHPAPRLWDLAYSIYCWAPFKTHKNDKMGNLQDQIQRALCFCDGYGADLQQRSQLVETMIIRLQALVDFMQAEADSGNPQFQAHIAEGHHLSYLDDIVYLQRNQHAITLGIAPHS